MSQIKMTYGIDNAHGGRGDDNVFLFNSLDAHVYGGKGFDTFEFRVFEDQIYTATKGHIVIDGQDGYHQEIVLHGFERIVVNELDY